jgi:hypothetical protein
MFSRIFCLLAAVALFALPAFAQDADTKPDEAPVAATSTKDQPEEPASESRVQIPDTPEQTHAAAIKHDPADKKPEETKTGREGVVAGARLLPEGKLEKGKPASFGLLLYDAEHADIKPDMLVERNKAKVRLLAIDESLADFHDAIAEPVKDGGWKFTFTPATTHNYVMWADFQLDKKEPQFVRLAVDGAEPCKEPCAEKVETVEVQEDDLTARLSHEGDLTANTGARLKLSITDNDGKELAPGKITDARMIALPADLKGAAMYVPRVEESMVTATASFTYLPQRPGFVRLYVEAQNEGKDLLFPFSVKVGERAAPLPGKDDKPKN